MDLGFGTLPAGVSAGSVPETTVSITDDDDAIAQPLTSTKVSFGGSDFSVPEGTRSVEVTINLSADPERTVTIPVTRDNQDGTTDSDYSGEPGSVTFNSGETEQSITFTATDDDVDDDGDLVKLGFGSSLPDGVSAGSTNEATVNIRDDDIAGVTVNPTGLSIDEGGSATYTVVLDTEPTGEVRVTIEDPTDNTDVTAEPASLVFTASNWRYRPDGNGNGGQDIRTTTPGTRRPPSPTRSARQTTTNMTA